MLKLETSQASPGDWVVISGHDPEDLSMHEVKVGNEARPALFEEDRMMVRCPDFQGRAAVRVDGVKVGILTRV